MLNGNLSETLSAENVPAFKQLKAKARRVIKKLKREHYGNVSVLH